MQIWQGLNWYIDSLTEEDQNKNTTTYPSRSRSRTFTGPCRIICHYPPFFFILGLATRWQANETALCSTDCRGNRGNSLSWRYPSQNKSVLDTWCFVASCSLQIEVIIKNLYLCLFCQIWNIFHYTHIRNIFCIGCWLLQ